MGHTLPSRSFAAAFFSTAVAVSFLSAMVVVGAAAQDRPPLLTLRVLSARLAAQAASEAVEVCRTQGYNVTATVVGTDGLRQVVVRGDGAPPHTIENSFNKAYTIITLGPIVKKESTAEIAKSMTQPAATTFGLPIAPLPGITFSAGAVAVTAGGQIIAGLGVSGAPGGNFDEQCANAGLRKIAAELTR